MDIKEYIDRLRIDPKAFKIIGKGAHCLALIDRKNPNEVLLLESGKPSAGDMGLNATTDRAHARAITFARQYDQYVKQGVTSVTNHAGDPFIHSDLISSLDPQKFGLLLPLYIGPGKMFYGSAARLIRRIPGKAMDYLDFVDPKNPLSNDQMTSISKDLARWLFTLHHQISPGAMVGNKIEKQFADMGRVMTTRAFTSDKYQVLVEQNIAEIRKLKESLNTGKMHPDFAQKVTSNLSESGINFNLLAEVAEMLTTGLKKSLPNDRIGLTHSDVHPANVIVSQDYRSVTGVCDWMSGGLDAQSVDFAGLGLAKGLLPRVVREYRKLEETGNVSKNINYESVYAYAAMRQIFIAVKAVKNGFGDGSTANVAWRQVSESVAELARINPRFRSISRKLKHQPLQPIRMPATRVPFASHPTRAAPT